MATQVWISTSKDPDRSDLGPQWRYAGDLDEHRETELWKVVQAYLGFRAFPRRQSVGWQAVSSLIAAAALAVSASVFIVQLATVAPRAVDEGSQAKQIVSPGGICSRHRRRDWVRR